MQVESCAILSRWQQTAMRSSSRWCASSNGRTSTLRRASTRSSGLLGRVDAIRAAGRRVLGALEALPEAVAVAEQSERDALAREEDARAELDEAERRLDEVSGARRSSDEAKTEAVRAVRRATVAATDAADTVARMRERVEALAATRSRSKPRPRASPSRRSTSPARSPRCRASPTPAARRPGRSLAEIDEWGARAHAALFVVRGGLESEREKVVLEANALAAAALGEQTAGASVALVRRRLEESLAQG